MNDLSAEGWAAVGVGIVQVSGIIAVLIKTLGAKAAANKAADQTIATGNGFAKRVEESLKAITEKVKETNDAVKENRDDMKALRTEAQADRQVVVRHLEGHLRSGSKD